MINLWKNIKIKYSSTNLQLNVAKITKIYLTSLFGVIIYKTEEELSTLVQTCKKTRTLATELANGEINHFSATSNCC